MDWAELREALNCPEAYPAPPGEVTSLETHISVVYLAGDRVYKLKKPVDLGFLDFSTPEQRLFYCEEEVRLNRRLSTIYLGVRPVVRERDGAVRVGGRGEVLDHVVEMERLPELQMMDHKLDRGEIDNEALGDLVERIVRFHAGAATGPDVDVHGSVEAVSEVVLGNLEDLAVFVVDASGKGSPASFVPRELFEFLQGRLREFLEKNSAFLEQRVREGKIREGHGDLHAANICFAPEGIVIYDCLEFAPHFRCGDVALDLAFLAMDLDYRCFRGFSRYLVYRYAGISGDRGLARLLGFYKTHRALVRAKVKAIHAGQVEGPQADAYLDAAARYLQLAITYWLPPVLVLMCGLPGTGKSWAARHIAPPFEAAILRSDAVRQQLREGAEEGTGLDRGLYEKSLRQRVYDLLLESAAERLDEGRSVIVDATFGSREARAPFLALARERGLPVAVVETTCSEETVRQRLERREARPRELSEADYDVYRHLSRSYEAPDEVPLRLTWTEESRPRCRVSALLARLVSNASPREPA